MFNKAVSVAFLGFLVKLKRGSVVLGLLDLLGLLYILYKS